MKLIKLTAINRPTGFPVWINPEHIISIYTYTENSGVERTAISVTDQSQPWIVKETPEWIIGVLEDAIHIYKDKENEIYQDLDDYYEDYTGATEVNFNDMMREKENKDE